jgi:CheY-like chemotaxis protein
LLGKLGYTPQIVSNGEEVLEALADSRIDLILMDCHMPLLDGFEASKEIIRRYTQRRPIIIALSASTLKEDIEQCFASGMDSFLSKPISVSQLSRKLMECSEALQKAHESNQS